MKTKRIDVSFEVKNIDEDDRFYMFEGYASTFGNIDRGNDRVMKGAFKECIENMRSKAVRIPGTDMSKLMPVLWQHQHDNPIGSFVEMREDEKGLYVKGILPKDDDLVKGRVIPQMKAGSVSDMSIGYQIVDYTQEDGVLNLDKLNLFETSLVTIPMNAEANVTAFKGYVSCSVLPVADKGVSYDEKGIDEDAYLYLDEDGKAHAAIAGMVDGELKAIPELIFKAAAMLMIEKGFDAKRDDRAKLLNDYYEKMGLESPFEKSYLLGENEADTLTTRELEKFLFINGVFSKEGAKLIASKFKSTERDAGSEGSERDAASLNGDALIKALNEINSIIEGKLK